MVHVWPPLFKKRLEQNDWNSDFDQIKDSFSSQFTENFKSETGSRFNPSCFQSMVYSILCTVLEATGSSVDPTYLFFMCSLPLYS